jgi:hypothetical protein
MVDDAGARRSRAISDSNTLDWEPAATLSRTAAILFVAGCLTRAAAAANLVPDPGFAQPDLMGWLPSFTTSAVWSSSDEAGGTASGSMRLFGFGASVRVVRCVPVTGGERYAFGASARLPELPASDQVAQAVVQWWSASGCSGAQLGPTVAGKVAAELPGQWGTVEGWGVAPATAASASFFLVSTAGVESALDVLFDNAFFIDGATCIETAGVLCLNGDRFLVAAEWFSRHFAAGYGHAARMTDDSGYFTFFADENVELVVKLLDACSTPFHRFWFFAAGLTDIGTTIRVFDTLAGGERSYGSVLEEPFAPIQDTSAFATCP